MIVSYAPAVVVVRHPDYGDDITCYGVEPRVVYIDLGASFDKTPDDEGQARAWARAVWRDVCDLPPGHPARQQVLDVIKQTVARYFDGETLEGVLDDDDDDAV